MKKWWNVACAALAVSAGCGPDIELGKRPVFSNGVTTITFLAYDATTGAAVNNATVKVTVGAYNLNVAKQNGNAYVVSQVPPGTHIASFEAPGYLSFQGQPTATCNSNISGPTSTCFVTYQVALFPVEGVEDNLVVKVYESEKGAAVPSGKVVATLTGTSNLVGTGFSNPLPGSLTLRPNTVVAELGADGSATLPKEQLVFGGTYSIDVFGARSATGVYLTPVDNETLTVSRTFPQINLFVGPPSVAPIAVSANNETPGVDATLVVRFPFPVEICSDPKDHDWYVWNGGADGNSDGIRAAPDNDNPVTATVSGDGSQLTVTPNFETSPPSQFQAADGLLEINFRNIEVKVKGSNYCLDLGDVRLRDGGYVSTRIRMAESL